MKALVLKPFLHPETQVHCGIGSEAELSYAHFQYLEGLGAVKIPPVKTKEEKAIYGKGNKGAKVI